MVIDILVWKMDASGRFFQIDSKATPRQFLRYYFLKKAFNYYLVVYTKRCCGGAVIARLPTKIRN